MVSDEKPFKVTDRRFTTTSFVYNLPEDKASDENTDSKTYAAKDFRYKPREEPVGDEYDEAFRTAYLGESAEAKAPYESSDSTRASGNTSYTPSGAVAEKYEPVAAPHDSRVTKVSYQANDNSGFMGVYIGAAALACLGLMFFLGVRANNTSNNYTPTQQIYSSAPVAQPQTVQVEQPKNSRLPAFEEYEKQRASWYNEFERSREPALTSIPLQSGLIHPAYESGAEAFALDLNEDGRNETLVRVNNGAFSFVFSPEGQEILHDNIIRVSDLSTNGYLNVFTERGATWGKGAKYNIRYAYNGQKYSDSARLMNQTDIVTMSRAIEELFGDMSNPGMMSMYLKNIEGDIGTHNALLTFMQFQAPQGVYLLGGSEYREMLRLYDRENGTRFLDAYANDPAGFEHATLSHAYDRLFFDTSNPKGWFLIGASAAAKSVAKDLGMDSESQFVARIDRMEQESGYVSAYRNATGRNPTLREWTDLKYRSNAITEDKLRTHQGYSEEIGTTHKNPDGTSQYRGNIYPGATQQQIRDIQAQQQRQAIEQRGQENLQRAQQDLQQGAERGRQMINQGAKQLGNIFKAPEKKK